MFSWDIVFKPASPKKTEKILGNYKNSTLLNSITELTRE